MASAISGTSPNAARTAHRRDIPAGLDLDLDALVAGGELALDLVAQLLERILNADGDAGCNALRVPPRTRESGCLPIRA